MSTDADFSPAVVNSSALPADARQLQELVRQLQAREAQLTAALAESSQTVSQQQQLLDKLTHELALMKRCRAGASKSCGSEDGQEVVGVESAIEAFVLDPAFVRFLASWETDCQPSDCGEVGRAIAVLLSPLVFAEAHIEHPMLTVLDAPVPADGVSQQFGARRMRADIQPGFPGFLSLTNPSRCDGDECSQTAPYGTLRMIARDLQNVAGPFVGSSMPGLGGLVHVV